MVPVLRRKAYCLKAWGKKYGFDNLIPRAFPRQTDFSRQSESCLRLIEHGLLLCSWSHIYWPDRIVFLPCMFCHLYLNKDFEIWSKWQEQRLCSAQDILTALYRSFDVRHFRDLQILPSRKAPMSITLTPLSPLTLHGSACLALFLRPKWSLWLQSSCFPSGLAGKNRGICVWSARPVFSTGWFEVISHSFFAEETPRFCRVLFSDACVYETASEILSRERFRWGGYLNEITV